LKNLKYFCEIWSYMVGVSGIRSRGGRVSIQYSMYWWRVLWTICLYKSVRDRHFYLWRNHRIDACRGTVHALPPQRWHPLPCDNNAGSVIFFPTHCVWTPFLGEDYGRKRVRLHLTLKDFSRTEKFMISTNREKEKGYYAILWLKSNTDLRCENWQKLHVQNGIKKVNSPGTGIHWRSVGFAPPLWRPGCDSALLPVSGFWVIQRYRMRHEPPTCVGLAQGGRRIVRDSWVLNW